MSGVHDPMTPDDPMDACPQPIVDALVASAAEPAPHDLYTRIVANGERQRASGEAIRLGANSAEPLDAFVTTATELHDLLLDLDDGEWDAATTTIYGSVRDVVAHLAGIEDYCTRALDRVPASDAAADFDHPACSRDVAESLATLTNAELADTWFALSKTFAERYATDPDTETVSLHQLPVTIAGAFVLRTFELWAHTEDICAAVGRPLPRLDGPRLACMASRLVEAIGFSVANEQRPDARARIVLIGPGGGVAEIGAAADAEGSTEPSLRLVADVVDYCRVAARRLNVNELDYTASGDESILADFFTATRMFAKD